MTREHKLKKARRWMSKDLAHHREDYDDCGEINCTKLAESCADAMDFFDEDDAIPPELFDISFEVAQAFEEQADESD